MTAQVQVPSTAVSPLPPEPAPGFLLPPAGHGRDRVSVREALQTALEAEDMVATYATGALMAIVPFVGPMVLYGWGAEIVQRVHLRHPTPVPKLRLTDFAYWLQRGITPFVAAFATNMAIQFALSIVILPIYIAAILAMAGGGMTLAAAILIPMMLLTVGLAAAGGVFMNAVLTRADLTEDFGETLKLSTALEFGRRTFVPTLLGMLKTSVVAGALFLLGLPLLIVGSLLAIPAATVIGAHVRAQVYELDLRRTGKAIPVRAPQYLPAEREAMGAAR
jgi:hypothetical protein